MTTVFTLTNARGVNLIVLALKGAFNRVYKKLSLKGALNTEGVKKGEGVK